MDKKEILEKSRRAREDEGMEYAVNKGRRIGFAVFILLYAVMAIFALLFGREGTFNALSSLVWVFLAAEAYVKYRFVKGRVYLVTAIAAGIAALGFAAGYIVNTLR